eukprot:gnl/MRDRNA2_/MRDRNA2_98530_c0_seq1.p1 gnl/MRDRNA2_/MRDRNA2_98530_c0~~gnl/MRDRNA2_/MRDRNA2_98530_c0_seq1.p1  ORF type:complete len:384 (+),score=72.36 gnl/MRDRNA2_/MRDRNA2_98530_c0_seq1:75-1226(+)
MVERLLSRHDDHQQSAHDCDSIIDCPTQDESNDTSTQEQRTCCATALETLGVCMQADGCFDKQAQILPLLPVHAGTIKSFDPKTGYGFIDCPEVFAISRRDVFIHYRQLQNFAVGDPVKFSVKNNKQGNPQAYCLDAVGPSDDIKTVASGKVLSCATQSPSQKTAAKKDDQAPTRVADTAMEVEVFYEGVLKSLNPLKGYGFVESDEVYKLYGRDVFAHWSQCAGTNVGEHVKFRIQVRRGQPQAVDIVLKSEAESKLSRTPINEEFDSKATRKLLRICGSSKLEWVEEMLSLLENRADPNGRDVTGQTALMAAALQSKNSEEKCRLLIQHGADVNFVLQEDMTVLEWVRVRIGKPFARYLEAWSKGENPTVVTFLGLGEGEF